MEEKDFCFENIFRRDNVPREYLEHIGRLSEGLDVDVKMQFCPQEGRRGYGDALIQIRSNCAIAFSELNIRVSRIEGLYEKISPN